MKKNFTVANPPLAVRLFLRYGYVSEHLLTEKEQMALISLPDPFSGKTTCQVYTMEQWLKEIYLGHKNPSKDEFNEDYEDHLRKELRSNRLTEQQYKMALSNADERLHFEIYNLMMYTDRILNGNITSFVPVLCSDAIPNRYAFTNAHMFKGEFEPQTVVAVDVASVQLFGENNGMTQFSRHVDLCIDHHAGNSGYADFTLLNGSAAAAAELLYEVINAMGVAITPHIADCLYTGLATDTGCFRFSSTTANTHIVAAKLIEAGCHVEELNTLLFDTKPRERMEAERIARNHLEYYLDGRCALIYLTRDEIEQSRVDPADLEELTSLPVSIEGVKVGLTLRQQPGGSYRISVRTAKGVDACAIARRLGGGGHTRAAGCELLGNLDNAKNAILAEVQAELDRPEMQEEG